MTPIVIFVTYLQHLYTPYLYTGRYLYSIDKKTLYILTFYPLAVNCYQKLPL